MINLSPDQILWELPVHDGYLYRAEKWRADGLHLKRSAPHEIIHASKYFSDAR